MTKNKQNISIEFTKAQFLALLKTVYLGNWMANAHRDGSVGDPHKSEYETTEDYIFSFARQFGFGAYVDDRDAKARKFYPTGTFEDETDIHELHEEYDEESFWDELIDRLGERDFYRHYSKDEIQKMNRNEWCEKLYAFMDKWADEINDSGVERLGIVEGDNK